MSREIKFRAWDKGLSNDDNIPMMTQALTIQEWIDQRGFYYVNGCQADLSDFDWKNELIFMQYTGLKDKNGVEIYEGDIVKTQVWTKIDDENSSGDWYFGEIVYHQGSFLGRFPKPEVMEYLQHFRYEVIGNIYENPELLKRKVNE